ncbi:hypothetical protein BDZ91DRAFT_683893 [Kalaharituber pfeilii]|nr:hypothetical protein BDZ91DRAFT_683893 [Kalaharituber pfeilii]
MPNHRRREPKKPAIVAQSNPDPTAAPGPTTVSEQLNAADSTASKSTLPCTTQLRGSLMSKSTASPTNPMTAPSTVITGNPPPHDHEEDKCTKQTATSDVQKAPPGGRKGKKGIRENEYHHFIPRFVLRQFATRRARRIDFQNPFINLYDMGSSTIVPAADVHRSYGNYDMYRDASAADQMHIEDALAVLEGQASRIIKRIKTALAKGENSVTLTRVERNDIRKFLFVMKFRTQGFWGKYNRTLEEYDAVDRAEVLHFMERKGFTKPLEVWLHTMKTILDTHIDVEDKWEQTMMSECFSHDAQWFILNMNMFYMSFCTPADAADEFLLSESAFGIHEGPTEAPMEVYITPGPNGMPDSQEALKSKYGGAGKYLEYHLLAPFGPTLLLVLRSNMLRDEESKKRLRAELAKQPGLEQLGTPSLFEHIHLQPPVPSYGLVTIDEFNPKEDDTFMFKLHKLRRRDVQLFNSIFLNEVKSTLTWTTDAAVQRTLQVYLEDDEFRLPMGFSLAPGSLEDMPLVVRRDRLWKLLGILKDNDAANIPVPSIGSHFKGLSEMERNLQNNRHAQGYFKLGGIAASFLRDMEQASIVSRMRTLVADSLPDGTRYLPYRRAAMRNEYAFFSTLPSTVIYLHVKLWRVGQAARLGAPGVGMDDLFNSTMEQELGAEDAVANLANKIPKEHHSRLMLQASVRKVSQMEHGRAGNNTVEFTSFAYWGGLVSSFLLEGTPLYDPSIGQYLVDPKRDESPSQEMFLNELAVRWTVKRQRMLESKWGKDVARFAWQWLYAGPDDM